MVYVSTLKRSKNLPSIAYMVADMENELQEYATKLNLKKKEFPTTARLRHYNVSEIKRLEAIKIGAIPVDDETFYMRFLRPFYERKLL